MITDGTNVYGKEFTVMNDGQFNCGRFVLNNWISGALITFLGEDVFSIIPLDLYVIPVPSKYNKMIIY